MSSLADIQALLANDKATARNLPDLLDQISGGGVVPFVGAGLSAPFGYPLWKDFLLEMADEAGIVPTITAQLANGEYEEAAAALLDALGVGAFQDILADRFGDAHLSQTKDFGVVSQLLQLPRGPLVTTNFDRVLETAFERAGRRLTPCWDSLPENGTEAFQQNAPILLKLHGDFNDANKRVLTLDEYRRTYGSDDATSVNLELPLPQMLERLLTMRCCLFLGCGLAHDRTMRLLGQLAKTNARLHHYAVLEYPAGDTQYRERSRFLSNLRIRPIRYRTGEHTVLRPLLEGLFELARVQRQEREARESGAPAPKPTHNIPALPNATIGRDADIARGSALLHDHRFVTILGAGGTGKSRLAIEIAGKVRAEYPNGVWFVGLAAMAQVADDEGVLSSRVASIAGITEQGRPPLESLISAFSAGPTLLVLDNCEHLLNSCRELVEGLLPYCPELRILATSRRRLDRQGEQVLPLEPLAVPEENLRDPLLIASNPSVQLFVARAQNRRPQWTLRSADAPAIAELCRALSGIPLAIEVTASRIAVMSIDEMRAHTGSLLALFGTLDAGSSAQDVLLWSYGLLSTDQQRTMRLMTIFDGGWTSAAAKAVVGEAQAGHVVDHLQELSDNSLVETSEEAGVTRFRYLEPIRQAAAARMTEQERAEARTTHAAFFVQLAERGEPALLSKQQMDWLARLQAEIDNFRAVVRWAVETKDAESGLRLMAAFWRFADMRGAFAEWRKRCEEVLAIEGAATFTAAYARVQSGLGMLAYRQADFTEAEKRFQTSLDLERSLKHDARVANALGDLGNIANQKGDFVRARDLYQQALTIEEGLAVEEGGRDPRLIAVARFNLGVVELGQGRYVEAELLLKESFTSFDAAGNLRESAFPLHVLGQLNIATGRVETGRDFAEKSLAIRERLKDEKGIADAHRTLAWAAIESGEIERAREHLVTSLTRANGIGDERGLAETLEIMGLFFTRIGQNADAVTVLVASDLRRAGKTYSLPPVRAARRDAALIKASTAIGAEDDARARALGTAMQFPDAMEPLLAMLRRP